MYLQKWAESGLVQVYSLIVANEQVPLWKSKPIRRTGSRKNLYVRVEDSKEYDDFEHFFAEQFESPAKKPIEKACKGERLSPEDWNRIINFVCAQYVRTPVFQQLTQNNAPNIISDSLDAIAKELKSITPEEIKSKPKEHLEESNLLPISLKLADEKSEDNASLLEISMVAGKNVWLFTMKSILKEDSLLQKYMHNIKWSIISSYNGVVWPTSDNPVLICDKNNYGSLILQKDLGVEGKIIILPISPSKALIGTQKREYDYRMKADKDFSKKLKYLIVENAFLNVYSCFEDNTIPIIRPRLVDEAEFHRINKVYDDWFDIYKDQEGPLLKSQKNRTYNEYFTGDN